MIFRSIDIFCHVVDNFGDAGFAYRLAKEMKLVNPQCRIRVFIDDPEAISAVNPAIDSGGYVQRHEDILFIDSSIVDSNWVSTEGCADVLIEALGCYTPESYLERALFSCPLIINLEYLSAEKWVEDCHLKESFLPKGKAKKYFFMQGFTKATGGVIFNSRVQSRKKDIVEGRLNIINSILQRFGIRANVTEDKFTGTVFTYERGFDTLLTDLKKTGRKTLLLCFGSKSHKGMQCTLSRLGAVFKPEERYARYSDIEIAFLPFIPQHEYDTLLCCTNFNLVRGEDSLVQALASSKPFVWNAYIQNEKYQLVKVEAFCNAIRPFFEDNVVFASYRDLLLKYNDAATETPLQNTKEDYKHFFNDLQKIEHATSKMCYFIKKDCNLIANLNKFLHESIPEQ